MMIRRVGIAIALILLLSAGAAECAQPETPGTRPGLSFELTPYIWLPTIDTTTNYPVPGGGTATTTLSADPGDYIPKLNFGVMLGGMIRYNRFSVSSDLLYMNASTDASRIRSVEFGTTNLPVDRTLSTSVSTRIESTIWTLAGGYTAAEGAWGNIDLLAGLRVLALSERTNYSLGLDITRPDRSIALGRMGSLTASKALWNGVAGVRGRLYLGHADWFGGGRFYVPFYIDIGAGGADLTWQAFGGLGYHAGRVGVSIGYRYLSFQQGSSAVIQKLTLGGPIIVANIVF